MTENGFDKNNQNQNSKDRSFYDEEFEKKPFSEQEPPAERRSADHNEYYSGVTAPRTYSDGAQRQPPPKKKAVTVLIMSLVVVASLLLGYVFFPLINSQYDEASMFLKAMDLLEANYLYDFDYNTVFSNMCKGNSLGLDRYTHIATPYEYYELVSNPDNDDLMYGVSFYLAADEKEIPIYWSFLVTLDSAADFAGLTDGDEIVKINAKTITTNTTSAELMSLLAGESATFTVKREGKLLDPVTVKRSRITSRYVEFFFVTESNVYTNFRYEQDGEYTFKENYTYGKDEKNLSDFHHYDSYSLKEVLKPGTGYIRLHEFTYTEAETKAGKALDFIKAMEMFKTAYDGRGKLVFDLRYNRGGFIDYCVTASSYFIYRGKPDETLALYSMEYKDKSRNSYTTKSKYAECFQTADYKTNRNIVILTNEWSASASEMLTGAALAYETVIQIGTQTYGKGVAQTIYPLMTAKTIYNGKTVSSAYGLYFTYAFFLTPEVEGSESPYSDYCNHNDMNGDGITDKPEKGYMPLEGNILTETLKIMQRADKLLNP